MKILYLAHSRLPSDSANSIQVMHMCRALARNHSTVLFARPSSRHDSGLKSIFEYYHLPEVFEIILPPGSRLPGFDSINSYVWLFRALKNQKPDLCYGRHLKSVAAAAKMGFPVLYEAHELPKSRMEKLLIRQICKARSFIGMVFISNALKDEYTTIFPDLSPDRAVTAHDGINIDYMDRIKSWEDPLPGRAEAFRVGYVGGLRPEKGISLVLDIAGLLPEVDFHLVGGSKDEILFWQSRSRGMANIFFHGRVKPWRAVSYQRAFGLLLAPYQQMSWTKKDGRLAVVRDPDRFIGNSPLKYFEYMACQKPIITSDIPIAREVFTHGQDAVLLGENPADWAHWIVRLMQEPDRGRVLAENARHRALEFTWDKRAEKIMTTFDAHW